MGRIISRKYEELGQLGQGGQGVVYKVRHTEHKTILALKALPAYLLEDQDMVARFEQEAVVMTRLQHRNIARVLGAGRDDALNLSYFVMEYIQGRTLKQYLYEKGPLPLPEVLEIARQVASALDYAHNQVPPVIHRDIKPTNIMIEDHTGRAVVLDFGIAKELDDGERTRTKTGVMVGTWKYCSPEQLRHEPLSGSADVYSLGIVMYEIFTGKQFFGGLDEHAVLGKVLYDLRENEPSFDRPVPPAFAALITKAIAKARDKRYPRMLDLLNDLEACWWALDETKTVILSTPEPTPPQPEHAQSEIEKIEAQIRQLEEERQRRLLVSLQGQVREARERAEKEGARQVAATLFEQGVGQESIGEGQNRNHQYALAQQAYQEALQCFTRAAEEAAAAVVWRQAEQNRQEATTASADAERYRARERAPAAHALALATQARAEQAWEQRQYAHAGSLYVEARNLFEDARDLAYRETLKEEAEAARTQAQASRHAAVGENAEMLARSFFEEGHASEQRATVALTREEFTQAREFFLAAHQRYEQAQRQALRAQQRRQEVLALAGDVQAAQQRAQAEGTEVEQQEAYQQAERFRQQAATLLAANEFTRAQQMFVQAREQYEAATQAVARVRLRQQVTRIRREAEAARSGAEAVGAQRWFPAEWAAGQQEDGVGRTQEAQGELTAAIESYRRATQRWEQVREAALERAAQERLDMVRQHTRSARDAAEQVAAESVATIRFQQGRAAEQQAEKAHARKDFGEVQRLYEQARQQYEQAEQEAREEALRQNATQAAQDVQTAQRLASGVTDDSGAWEMYQHALAVQKQAEALVAQRHYSQAIQAYTQARAHYEEVARTAERERQQTALNRARQQAETIRIEAEQEGAPQRFAAAWRETETLVRRARQHEEQGAFQAATAVYREAEQRFAHLQREAQEQVAQEHARAVQQRMRKEKEQAQPFRPRAEEQWNAAQERESQGDIALQARDYVRAATIYMQAEADYHRTRTEGAERQQQEAQKKTAAEALLKQVQQVRSATGRAKTQAEREEARERAAEVYSKAVTLHTQAEELWQHQAYHEALSRYADAQQRYQEAQTQAQRERLREQAQAAQEQAQTAYEGALRIGAEELAPEVFAESRTLTQRAERALSKEEFLAATEAYRTASEQYQRASQLAQTESLRREVATSAELAEAAQQRATEFGTRVETHVSYRKARERHQQAEKHFRTQDYGLAKQDYEQARTLYDAAIRDAEQELRRTLTQARQAAEKAREEAERQEVPQRLADQWAVLLKGEQQARASEARGELTAAITALQELAVQYVYLRETALEHVAHEGALRAQQQVRVVKEDTKEWQAWAEPVWGAAVRLETAAEQAFQTRRYGDAEQGYQQAILEYTRAKREGEAARLADTHRLKQEVISVRQHAEAACRAAEHAGAARRFTSEWEATNGVLQRAQLQESRSEWQEAIALYEESTSQFSRLLNEAEREAAHEEEQRQRRAHIAQRRAAQSQHAVEQAEGLRLAQSQYATIMQTYQAGERSLAARQWIDAETLFDQAHEQFLSLATLMQSERAQRSATTAREEALTAHQQLQKSRTPELFSQQFAEINALLREGEQDFQRAEFASAQEKFRHGVDLSRHLAQQTERSLQKERAEQAREQALALQSQLQTGKGAQHKQAKKAVQQGDRLFAQGHYHEAAPHYETAVTLWTALQHTMAPASVPQASASRTSVPGVLSPTPRTRVGYAVVGGAVLILLVGLYFVNPFPKTSEQLDIPLVNPQLPVENTREAKNNVSVTPSEPKLQVQEETPEKTVLAPPLEKFPVPATKPLQITQATPDPTGEIAVNEGEKQTFVVVADSAAPDTVRYSWRMNGKEALSGTGKEAALWVYSPNFDEGGDHTKAVEVIVTDDKQQSVRRDWRVRVRNINRPPYLLSASPQPGSPLTAKAGEVKEFAVEITDPDVDDRLAYAWSLDGKEVAREKQWKFRIPPDGGTHKVSVEVSDPSGAKVHQEWLVSLKSSPPMIIKSSPAPTQELLVEEGKSLTFAVTAESAVKEALRYSWRVDGKVQAASGQQWTYSPGFSDGAKKPKQVEVNITNSDNQTVKETWVVRVQNVNQPPSIVKTSPKADKAVEVAAGGVQEFTVNAMDPDRDDRLAYVWSLDGHEVARSERWQFRAPAGEGSHRVTVEIQDREGMKKQQAWQVMVKAIAASPEPPVWSIVQPRDEDLTVQAGEMLTLAATAALPRPESEAKSTIRYVWSLNNEPAQTSQQTRFRFSKTKPGTYQVAVVAIAPSGLKSSPRQWTVKVRPPDIAVPPPSLSGKTELREAEVRDWLENYRRAWESKNTDQLVSLGVLSTQDATKLQQVLAAYREFRVTLSDVDIQEQGAQATVSFKRVDTMDRNTVPHPNRTTILLEKRSDGRIVVQK
jgi:serine/threonine protein kinase